MSNNKKKIVGDLISDIKTNITSRVLHKKIPDIITFVENPEWLGLPYHPSNPINLFPIQKIMLKAFYKGTVGNEDIDLTEDEIKLCEELSLEEPDRGGFLQSFNNGEIKRELVLVWGRRSGKDFVSSIIATYEAMKLLECEGGDPYKIYEISSANTINILTVANSSSQANIAFSEIRERILNSPYFKDKIVKDGITSQSIYLLTPKDKEDNKNYKDRGFPLKKGSVGIIVGHSNSDTLLGMGCIVLILDEVASYKMTGGSSSGDRIYAALTPTVQTYVRKCYLKDENGNIVRESNGQPIIKERHYDGKIISISSPRGKEGKFYELFRDSLSVPSRLSMRLATWEINPSHTRESLREKDNTLSEPEFNMEYGANFSGTGLEHFFSEDQIKPLFIGHNYRLKDMGEPGHVYFMHIDPATSSHNYALVIIHKEYYFNKETNKSDYIIVVDYVKYWTPVNGPLDVNSISSYIVGLKKRFHFGLVTYDQWSSLESILKLRKAGIPNQLTRFTNAYKMLIYKELENVINAKKIIIPKEERTILLYNEMINIQRKFTATGFKVMPKKDGDGIKSDDLIDCLAGACYIALKKQFIGLPSSTTVEFGNVHSQNNNIVWRNPSGVLGVGSGQQVARQLEKLQSWPDYKRY